MRRTASENGLELVRAKIEIAAGRFQEQHGGRELELAIGDSRTDRNRRRSVDLGLQLPLEKNVDGLREGLLELRAKLRREDLHVQLSDSVRRTSNHSARSEPKRGVRHTNATATRDASIPAATTAPRKTAPAPEPKLHPRS